MIAQALQDCLVDELGAILKGYRLKNRDGKLHDINIYPQSLPEPKPQTDAAGGIGMELSGFQDFSGDSSDEFFPFIIVYVHDGVIQEGPMAHTVQAGLAIGTYDGSSTRQGHRDILQIISKIEERFEKNNILAKKFILQFPMEWSLQDPDDDTHPYYFGGLSLNFDTPTYRRECRNS